MAVYVDQINDYSHKSSVGKKALKYGHRWCHLYADSLEELHEMADKIGLQRRWFQDRSHFPHYDLTNSKRELALANGAIDDSNHKILGKWTRDRVEKANKR